MSKIVCVGLQKTGTTSFRAAMEELGYTCTKWSRQVASIYKRGHIDALLDMANDFDAFQDGPWYLLHREMQEKFPDLKLVLTRRRSMDAWYASLIKHVDRKRLGKFSLVELVYGTADVHNSKDQLIAAHEKHLANIRAFASENDIPLLEVAWDEGDGWAQLCPFLGVDIPDRPFPHANAAPAAQSRVARLARSLLR